MAAGEWGAAADLYDQAYKTAKREQRKDAEAYLEERAARQVAAMKKGGDTPNRSIRYTGSMLDVGKMKREARARRLLRPMDTEPEPLAVETVSQFRHDGLVLLPGLVSGPMLKGLTGVGWGIAEATRTQPPTRQLDHKGTFYTVTGWGDNVYLSRIVAAAANILAPEHNGGARPFVAITTWLALSDATSRPFEPGVPPELVDPRDAINYRAGDVSFHFGRVLHSFCDSKVAVT